jgi:hypothetical protein
MNAYEAKAQHVLYPAFIKKLCGGFLLLELILVNGYLLLTIIIPGFDLIRPGYRPPHGELIPQILSKLFIIALFCYVIVPLIVDDLFESSISISLCDDGFLCKYPIKGTKLRRWADFKTITITYKLIGNGSELILQPAISCLYWEREKSIWGQRIAGNTAYHLYIFCDEGFIEELIRLRPGGVYDVRSVADRIISY